LIVLLTQHWFQQKDLEGYSLLEAKGTVNLRAFLLVRPYPLWLVQDKEILLQNEEAKRVLGSCSEVPQNTVFSFADDTTGV
jgi:hypothetical protein